MEASAPKPLANTYLVRALCVPTKPLTTTQQKRIMRNVHGAANRVITSSKLHAYRRLKKRQFNVMLLEWSSDADIFNVAAEADKLLRPLVLPLGMELKYCVSDQLKAIDTPHARKQNQAFIIPSHESSPHLPPVH